MKWRLWTIRAVSLALGLSIALLIPHSTYAENPFPGETAPQPTPTPPLGNFSEDDEFAPDNTFGFQPPAQPPANPPPPVTPPQEPAPPPLSNNEIEPRPPQRVGNERRNVSPPSRPSPISPPHSPVGSNGSRNGVTSQSANNQNGTKPPPKLAEYLELEPSVRGLEVKNFDLPDKDIKDVVTLISKWTGKNFILDNKVRGKITIIGPSQVTLQEAYQAFLSALEANGLTTVQSGKFIRIIEAAEARRSPVRTYAGDYAPKDDQFITRIFQLRYINSDEVQREFRDLTSRSGKLFAYEPTNSIIITDTGSNIQRIKEILETLDVKNFETTLHVLRIRNGSAKSIAEMLGEIYSDGKGGGAPGQPRSFKRSALERTRGGGIISKIIPDEQTNSLVILANHTGYQQLVQLVDKLDVKVTDTGRIHVYYCEYAKAEDLAQTLASLAQGGKGGSSKRTSSSSTPSTPGQGGIGQSQSAPASSGPVTAELEGGAKITSDAATNGLVIVANSSDWQTLKRVIRKLDIPRLQVFVESAILEVNLGNKDKVGVNIASATPGRVFAGGVITDSESLVSTISGGLPPNGATIPIFGGNIFTQNQTSTTGATTSVTEANFMGLLNLITTQTNTSVLSTPQIIALDNEKAEFQVIDEIPVQSSFSALSIGGSSGLGTGFGGTPMGNITRQKVGIVLKLTPHVNAASKTVRLEIEQKVDSIKNNAAPSALQNVQVATTSRVTNTSVVVHDQDYIMLGGMMSDKVDETTTKVPLLGDIPILGWLFKSKTYDVQKTNLIVLMHPRIIENATVSANVISDQFKKRDKFINQSNGGDEPFRENVDELKHEFRSQKERGKEEPIFDYRNNNDDDQDEKPKPGEQSQLSPSSSSSVSEREQRIDNSGQNAAPPPPQGDQVPPLQNIPGSPPPDAPLIEPGNEP